MYSDRSSCCACCCFSRCRLPACASLPEEIDYSLMYRWFVGLSMDGRVWSPTRFSKNRYARCRAILPQLQWPDDASCGYGSNGERRFIEQVFGPIKPSEGCEKCDTVVGERVAGIVMLSPRRSVGAVDGLPHESAGWRQKVASQAATSVYGARTRSDRVVRQLCDTQADQATAVTTGHRWLSGQPFAMARRAYERTAVKRCSPHQ